MQTQSQWSQVHCRPSAIAACSRLHLWRDVVFPPGRLRAGANKGIGYEVARLLASQGITVILTARNGEHISIPPVFSVSVVVIRRSQRLDAAVVCASVVLVFCSHRRS